MNRAVSVEVCGERLLLHSERAVIWPRCRAAIVADTHFGKSSVFGRNGLAVPAGSDGFDRSRLISLVSAFDIRRIIVLGDFLHAPLDAGSEEAINMQAWNASLSEVAIQVIAGNHDRGVSSGWRGSIDWIAGEHVEPPFRFVHDASGDSRRRGVYFTLSGHVHPVVSLKGLRKRPARVPVFWLQQHGLILPAFGSFTGGYKVSPAPGEQVFAVSPELVIPFPARQPVGGSGT